MSVSAWVAGEPYMVYGWQLSCYNILCCAPPPHSPAPLLHGGTAQWTSTKSSTAPCRNLSRRTFPMQISAHWMMFSCPTSPASWRTSAPSRVWRRTLTWRSSRRCWKLTYLVLLKLRADEDNGVPKPSTKDISLKLATLPNEPPPGREAQCRETPTEGATAKLPVSEWEAQEQHLLEMFPKCSLSEARSALSIAKGDMEEAVRLIIEGDVQLSPTPLNVNHGKSVSPVADQKLKESILEKYMLVDRDEDKKTHRPVPPKDAPKKLVRYHGNQVVTTKGERYQLVKTNETEDMKKTYVNLKPARKYRFH
uniref:CUE domain containing 2 n=1 Tax=Scophthalmus maximus TaxID=52904 RepID=A0A8D3E7Z1_SCOMX